MIDEAELQILLMERAERLHSLVQKKAPRDLLRIISAEDILQEVWFAAFRNVATFTANGPDALDRWLTRIAERKLVDALRAARTKKRGGGVQCARLAQRRQTSYLDLFASIAGSERTPSSETGSREAVHAVQVALSMLTDDVRRAIVLRYIEGKSRAEVAETMKKSPAAVNSLLFRGLRMLRGYLGPEAKFFSGDPMPEKD